MPPRTDGSVHKNGLKMTRPGVFTLDANSSPLTGDLLVVSKYNLGRFETTQERILRHHPLGKELSV